MDLTQLANLGEFIGGVAVLVTLIYLAVQVRHQSNTQAGSNELEAARLFAEYEDFIAANPDLQRLWETALADPENFDDEEKSRLWWLMGAAFRRMEGIYHQHRRGLISPETWKAWEDSALAVLQTRYGEEWWLARVTVFSSPFRTHLDTVRKSGATPHWRITDALTEARGAGDP